MTGFTHVEHVMGMPVSLDVRTDVARSVVAPALRWLHWVDATFSTYRPDSPVSRIARGELAVADAEELVQRVVAECDRLRRQTGGYFDALAGGRFDPSGWVKGWAVEGASELLLDGGAACHCVNAGGDVRVRGEAGPGQPWLVGIAHPLVGDALCAVVGVSDGAVATSGTAERGAHVIDPHTGAAALDLASVTVVGPVLAEADAFATAALAMGYDAPAWLERLDGFEAYIVDAGGYEWSSEGWPGLPVDPEQGTPVGSVILVGTGGPYS